jgi:hypothetical protein
MATIISIGVLILASPCTLADVYTYPVKSINLDSAASPVFYSAFDPNQISIGRTVDPHAVHGVEIGESVRGAKRRAENGADSILTCVANTSVLHSARILHRFALWQGTAERELIDDR